MVADEVRNLAGKTNHSTISIKEMIDSLQNISNQSMDLAKNSKIVTEQSKDEVFSIKDSFTSIKESITKVGLLSEDIKFSSEEQITIKVDIENMSKQVSSYLSESLDAVKTTTETSEKQLQECIKLSEVLEHFKV